MPNKVMIAFLMVNPDRDHRIFYTAIDANEWSRLGVESLSIDVANAADFQSGEWSCVAAWEMPERVEVVGPNDKEIPFVFGDPL